MTIKELREEKGLSQKAFAEAIGMKTPTIGAYEQGRIKPSEAVLAKIKEIYGVDVTTPAEQASPAEGAKPTKRTSQKKKEEAGSAPVPVEEAKPRKRGGRKKAGVTVVIQSPTGGSITPEEIIKKTGPVDAVCVRVDENKAYWVRGDETGSVDLW